MNHERRKCKMIVGDGFPIVAIAPERNSKCACGSGKKTKNCCGTDTRFFSTKTERVTKNQRNKSDAKSTTPIVNSQ